MYDGGEISRDCIEPILSGFLYANRKYDSGGKTFQPVLILSISYWLNIRVSSVTAVSRGASCWWSSFGHFLHYIGGLSRELGREFLGSTAGGIRRLNPHDMDMLTYHGTCAEVEVVHSMGMWLKKYTWFSWVKRATARSCLLWTFQPFLGYVLQFVGSVGCQTSLMNVFCNSSGLTCRLSTVFVQRITVVCLCLPCAAVFHSAFHFYRQYVWI
jgi:hypothetical protein